MKPRCDASLENTNTTNQRGISPKCAIKAPSGNGTLLLVRPPRWVECLFSKHPVWPIRNGTDSALKLLASESFILFYFFPLSLSVSPFPLATSLPEQKTRASETLMQRDANIGLHHMILGVVLRKLVFPEVARPGKSTWGLTPQNWPYSSQASSRPRLPSAVLLGDSGAACPAETGANAADTHQRGVSAPLPLM